MSRQREYQIRMKAAGLCTQCGQPLGRGKQNCDKCLDKRNTEYRKRYHRKHPNAVYYSK